MQVHAMKATIEDLYLTFSRYPLVPNIHGCPCCFNDADNALLHSKPLRELSADDLGRFAFKALSTWGDEDDLKHFLPRILELLPHELSRVCEAETVIGKLALGEWRAWPPDEVRSVSGYLHSLWTQLLNDSQFATPLSAVELLVAYSRVFDDLTPFLSEWEQPGTLNATRHFALLVEHWVSDSFVRICRMPSRSWSGECQVSQWLCEPARLAHLEEAFFACDDEAIAGEISVAVDRLSLIHARI